MAIRSRFREIATDSRAEGIGIMAWRVLSSANTSRLFVTSANKSSMNTRNRSSESTLPWGTPARMGRKGDFSSPITTRWERLERIHSFVMNNHMGSRLV